LKHFLNVFLPSQTFRESRICEILLKAILISSCGPISTNSKTISSTTERSMATEIVFTEQWYSSISEKQNWAILKSSSKRSISLNAKNYLFKIAKTLNRRLYYCIFGKPTCFLCLIWVANRDKSSCKGWLTLLLSLMLHWSLILEFLTMVIFWLIERRCRSFAMEVFKETCSEFWHLERSLKELRYIHWPKYWLRRLLY